MSTPDTKTRILTAAELVVLERGVSALTLDAVAEAAGLSKGGLIYHFESKEALIRAMIARIGACMQERMDRAGDGRPGGWTRAYLDAAFPPPGTQDDRDATREAALIAALGNDPALLAPYAAQYAGWVERQRTDGIDPILAAIVRLAADGLWLNEVFGIRAVDPADRTAVLQRLHAMTRGA
ncbi:TetR/AcrR family transcriptional regulator [Inquilinus limosus]|uniref:TetR/AcrR family transcriptional regulator n=1 Tax=Inquilinus limosus TaxID=171674 RepID=UPI000428B7C3|nr:TetR/AcrR family transcriptional regulator [Inquilinus limosus]